ncbi:MAG: heme exporter protein CcmD [Rhodospirillaceae bacterium]|nr:heme exporter protein CcmD [Rhodospirillaceae bacterium]|tara:strand:- start:486 stop:701 length:216 start_codon:yes stop_codon:yes gene_type:complete
MSEFLNMGGHGGFIWSSWGIAFVVLAILIGVSLKSMRARERELARMEAEMPRRRRRRNGQSKTDAAADGSQ